MGLGERVFWVVVFSVLIWYALDSFNKGGTRMNTEDKAEAKVVLLKITGEMIGDDTSVEAEALRKSVAEISSGRAALLLGLCTLLTQKLRGLPLSEQEFILLISTYLIQRARTHHAEEN